MDVKSRPGLRRCGINYHDMDVKQLTKRKIDTFKLFVGTDATNATILRYFQANLLHTRNFIQVSNFNVTHLLHVIIQRGAKNRS